MLRAFLGVAAVCSSLGAQRVGCKLAWKVLTAVTAVLQGEPWTRWRPLCPSS